MGFAAAMPGGSARWLRARGHLLGSVRRGGKIRPAGGGRPPDEVAWPTKIKLLFIYIYIFHSIYIHRIIQT